MTHSATYVGGGPRRWTATATYRTDAGPLDVTHDFEELDELHDLIERGPDWNTIDSIVIRLARSSGAITIEQAEAE